MLEENKNSATMGDITDKARSGPFGLLETDRPMLPGEDKIPVKDDKGFKTTGEKYYDRLQFAIGNVFILTATAVIAYIARYGKDSYGPVPNFIKKFQDGLQKRLIENRVLPLKNPAQPDGSTKTMARFDRERLAGVISNTTVLWFGGTAFSPAMRWMENNRPKIVDYFNRRWGKQGELEAGHERLKNLPKQTWGDVLKGRVVAWLTVFSAFTTFDVLSKPDKKTGMDLLDKYEEFFGRKFAGLTKSGKEISKTPLTQPLTEQQKKNPPYLFSKLLALDLYATTVSLIIWIVSSRSSARKRAEKNAAAVAANAPLLPSQDVTEQQQNEKKQDKEPTDQTKSFAAREGGKPKDFYAHAAEPQTTPGHAV